LTPTTALFTWPTTAVTRCRRSARLRTRSPPPFRWDPAGVAVDPTAHSVWVANSAAGSASQISDAANTVTNTVSFPFGNPWGIAADPSTGTVYLSDTADGITDSIDEATGAGTYNVFGYGGTGIAVDPNNSNVYVVVNGSPGSVAVLSPAGGTALAEPTVGSLPYGIAYDSADNSFYVANYSDGTVSVISEASDTVTATIPVGTQPVGVAADPVTHTVFVPNSGSNSVSVIEDTSNTVTATVPVGQGPYAVAADSSTGAVYVANSGDNSVSVLTPSSGGGGDGSGSVTANATVNQAVKLTGLTGTITFPAANAGSTATATGAEAYTAATNDPAGYTSLSRPRAPPWSLLAAGAFPTLT